MGARCCGIMRQLLSMMFYATQKLHQLSRYSVYVAAIFAFPLFFLHIAFAQSTALLPYQMQTRQEHAIPLSPCFRSGISKQNQCLQVKLNKSSLFTGAPPLYVRLTFSFLRVQQTAVAKFRSNQPQSTSDQPQSSQALFVKFSDARTWINSSVTGEHYLTNRTLTKVYRCFPASDFDTKT